MSRPTDIRVAHRHVERCMGTVFSIDVRAPGVDGAVLDSVLNWLHWADDTFSTYRPSSQINRLARGEITIRDCAPEVGEILEQCEQLTAQTDGYFSARIGAAIDPSGLVKGWAIEHASQMLRDAGSVNHSINGGGDVQCVGSARPGQPWRIGIAHPLRPGDLVGVAVGHELAVATSGSAERGAHIRDPHDGSRPAELASVTLIAGQLATVDAYATAAFAMGASAPAWITAQPHLTGLIVFADGREWASPITGSDQPERP